MKLNKYFFLLILISSLGFSQTTDVIPEKRIQKGFAMVDFLSVDMPTNSKIQNENHLGLIGKHFNLKFNNFYTGLGIYGALRGDRGGFFTLGVNVGYKEFLSEKLFLDSSIHFGGGGGAGAPDGSGAFILPKVNLGFQFKDFSLTSGYSYINFFEGGKIKSHQLNIALQIPLNIIYTNFSDAEKTYTIKDLENTDWNRPFSRFSLMFHLNNMRASGSSIRTDGTSLNGSTIRLAGFEISSYINKNWFTFLKFDGAYDGIRAGYMDVLLGGGYHFAMNKNRTNLLAKFGVGGGGGGGVDTQGGILIAPDISIEQHIFDNIYASINTGIVMSPNSHFFSRSYGFGLKYYTNINGIESEDFSIKGQSKFKGFEAIIKQDIYFGAQRMNNPTEDLCQIAFQLNYHLNKRFYLAGQTAFANFGNAGAYAEGIVGIGIQSNSFIDNKLSLFGQFLIGGAGGGDISTGEGLIIKPSVGLNYQISNTLSTRAAGGYVRSKGGTLDAYTANLGISYKLAFLNSK